jgi:hypothetical protein
MRAHLYELEEDLLRARIDERRLRLLKHSNRLLPPPPDLPPTP